MNIDKETVKYIVVNRKFPDSLAQFQKYDTLLSYAFFRKNIYGHNDYTYIADRDFIYNEKIRRDFLAILIISDFLLMLTVAFEDEINLELETLFETFPTHTNIPDYIKYFECLKAQQEEKLKFRFLQFVATAKALRIKNPLPGNP